MCSACIEMFTLLFITLPHYTIGFFSIFCFDFVFHITFPFPPENWFISPATLSQIYKALYEEIFEKNSNNNSKMHRMKTF